MYGIAICNKIYSLTIQKKCHLRCFSYQVHDHKIDSLCLATDISSNGGTLETLDDVLQSVLYTLWPVQQKLIHGIF